MSWRDRDYNRGGGHGARGFSGGGGGRAGGAGGTPMSMTKWLLIINCAIALLDGIMSSASRGSSLAPGDLFYFSIEKAAQGFQLWRWFTYQFVHAGIFHLAFNMIALYFFGPLIERWWGSRRFLAFYLLCGACGAVLFTLLSFVPDLLDVGPNTRLVGASGSIFGILVACAMLYPHQRVMLLIPPIPMSMRTLATVFIGIAVFSIMVGAQNAGGEAAHLGGAALGWLLIRRSHWLNFADGFGATLANMKRNQQRRTAQRETQRAVQEDQQVDHVLEKVRLKGLQSLTANEKRILQQATDRHRDE